MNTDPLAALRAKQPIKARWTPPTVSDLQHGRVLAFDQSLAATGAVVLNHIGLGGPTIIAAKVISTPATTEEKSTRESDVHRALILRQRITEWLRTLLIDGIVVVHEAVPEGPYIHRIESSLLSALAVRIACEDYGVPLASTPSIPARTHKKFACGNANASKSEHGNAIKKLGAEMPIGNFNLISNEATRDALSVALCALGRG